MPLDQEVLDSQDYKDSLASAISDATSPLQTSLNNLESNNGKLLAEKKQLAGEFDEFKSKFDGIDIEAMQARIAEAESDEVKELLAKGEYEKLYEKDKATLQADHDAQLQAAVKESKDSAQLASALQETLVLRVRDNGISQAFITKEADKAQLRSVQAIAKDTVQVKGEWLPVVSVDNDGNSVFRHSTTGEVLQNPEGTFGYSDWLVHLAGKEEIPLFAKPNGHGDPSAISDANPKGLVKSKMSSKEKQEFKKENGIPAFNALPFS